MKDESANNESEGWDKSLTNNRDTTRWGGCCVRVHSNEGTGERPFLHNRCNASMNIQLRLVSLNPISSVWSFWYGALGGALWILKRSPLLNHCCLCCPAVGLENVLVEIIICEAAWIFLQSCWAESLSSLVKATANTASTACCHFYDKAPGCRLFVLVQTAGSTENSLCTSSNCTYLYVCTCTSNRAINCSQHTFFSGFCFYQFSDPRGSRDLDKLSGAVFFFSGYCLCVFCSVVKVQTCFVDLKSSAKCSISMGN